MAIAGEPARMPEQGLPISLRTATVRQSTKYNTPERRVYLADRLPLGLFAVLDRLPLKELYLFLERLVISIGSLQEFFQLVDLPLVATRQLEFGDLLFVVGSRVPAGSESILLVA